MLALRSWAYPVFVLVVACGTNDEATPEAFGEGGAPDAAASRHDATVSYFIGDGAISFEAARLIYDALQPNWCVFCEEAFGTCDTRRTLCVQQCASGCEQATVGPYGVISECTFEAGVSFACMTPDGGPAMTLGGVCTCADTPKITDAGPCPFGCDLKTDAAGCPGRSFSGFQSEFGCMSGRSLWDGGRDASEAVCLAGCEGQTDVVACWYRNGTEDFPRDCRVCGADGGALVFTGASNDFVGTMSGSCGSGG